MKIRLVITILGLALFMGCDKKETNKPVAPDDRTNGPSAGQPAPAEVNTPPIGPAPVVINEAIGQPVAEVIEKVKVDISKEELYGKPGQTASSLDGVQWVKGEPVTFVKDQVYVVEFWATWCPPCRDSIPHLTELQKNYKDKKVTFIGITNEKDSAKVKKFVGDLGDKMDYTVAIDADRAVSDHYMKAFGARGIPHAFIVNGQGKIVWDGHPMGQMESVLKQVLAGTFSL